MANLNSVSGNRDNVLDIMPGITARKWRRLGYRIRGRVAMLLAEKHGKRTLRVGTAKRLREEIIDDLEILAQSKKEISKLPPNEVLRETLKNIQGQQKYLWKGNKEAIDMLVSIPDSPSEIAFVQAFLQKVMHIAPEHIERILLNSKPTL